MDIKEAIAKAADRIDLSEAEAKSVMEIMLSGEATQAQIAAFLTALRMKGETLDELVGLASVLRDKAETIATGGRKLCRSGRNRRRLYLYL